MDNYLVAIIKSRKDNMFMTRNKSKERKHECEPTLRFFSSMIRWMGGISMKDRRTSKKLRRLVGV